MSFSAVYRDQLLFNDSVAASAYLSLRPSAYSILDASMVRRSTTHPNDSFDLVLPLGNLQTLQGLGELPALVGLNSFRPSSAFSQTLTPAKPADLDTSAAADLFLRTNVTVLSHPERGKIVMRSGPLLFELQPHTPCTLVIRDGTTTTNAGTAGAATPGVANVTLSICRALPRWMIWGGAELPMQASDVPSDSSSSLTAHVASDVPSDSSSSLTAHVASDVPSDSSSSLTAHVVYEVDKEPSCSRTICTNSSCSRSSSSTCSSNSSRRIRNPSTCCSGRNPTITSVCRCEVTHSESCFCDNLSETGQNREQSINPNLSYFFHTSVQASLTIDLSWSTTAGKRITGREVAVEGPTSSDVSRGRDWRFKHLQAVARFRRGLAGRPSSGESAIISSSASSINSASISSSIGSSLRQSEALNVKATAKVSVGMCVPLQHNTTAAVVNSLPVRALLSQAGALATRSVLHAMAPSFCNLLLTDFEEWKRLKKLSGGK